MAKLEAVAWGYGLVEGPRADTEGNLYFSDVPNGGVYRRSVDGAIDVVVPKRRGVGGIALHASGGVVVSGRNISHVVGGETRILFAPEAMGLNGLFADPQGRVICGTLRADPFAESAADERVPGECWRIDAENSAAMLYGDVLLSNGIGLSPDGSVLYHSDSAARGVIAHDYAPGGDGD